MRSHARLGWFIAVAAGQPARDFTGSGPPMTSEFQWWRVAIGVIAAVTGGAIGLWLFGPVGAVAGGLLFFLVQGYVGAWFWVRRSKREFLERNS